MSTEDQDLQARIDLLAGKISQAKTGSNEPGQNNPVASRGVYHGRGAVWRGRGGFSTRGYRGKAPHIHRNRTLVLNGAPSNTNTAPRTESQENKVSPAVGSGWVSKTDRHMQLINTTVYEQDTQKRVKAIEQTRQQRLKQRDDREQLKLSKYLHRASGNHYQPSSSQPNPAHGIHELDVQGIRFRVTKGGSRLIRVSDDANAARTTPKIAVIGSVRFHRSKNGNLYRDGIIKAQRRKVVVKKIDEPCKMFSTTGSCLKGPRCRYIHNPSQVAVCRDFLQKGACPSGVSCDLSHDLTPERTPTCLHFTKGNCSKPNCRYSHVRVAPSALTCRSFGIYGYCAKGSSCMERHINECPDFSNTGICTTKGCKLLHREKASVMRTRPAQPSTSQEGDSDVSSSEEGEEIGSDDVDSDDLEEFFGDEDGPADTDIPMQQDFVQLS